MATDDVTAYLQAQLAGTTEEPEAPEVEVPEEVETPEEVQAPTPVQPSAVDLMAEMLAEFKRTNQPQQTQAPEPVWVNPYERDDVIEELAQLEASYDLEDKKRAVKLKARYDAEIRQQEYRQLNETTTLISRGQQEQNRIVSEIKGKFNVTDSDLQQVRQEFVGVFGTEAALDAALSGDKNTQTFFRSRLIALAAERPTPSSVPAKQPKSPAKPAGAATSATKPAEPPKKADTDWIHGPKDDNYNTKLFDAMFGRKK